VQFLAARVPKRFTLKTTPNALSKLQEDELIKQSWKRHWCSWCWRKEAGGDVQRQ